MQGSTWFSNWPIPGSQARFHEWCWPRRLSGAAFPVEASAYAVYLSLALAGTQRKPYYRQGAVLASDLTAYAEGISKETLPTNLRAAPCG